MCSAEHSSDDSDTRGSSFDGIARRRPLGVSGGRLLKSLWLNSCPDSEWSACAWTTPWPATMPCVDRVRGPLDHEPDAVVADRSGDGRPSEAPRPTFRDVRDETDFDDSAALTPPMPLGTCTGGGGGGATLNGALAADSSEDDTVAGNDGTATDCTAEE